MKYFIERSVCPACKGSHIEVIYEEKFTSPAIRDYLENFYRPQGGVEMSLLEDASYVLGECQKCKLVFQKFIGNDLLMGRLYEHWIDPKIIFDNEVQRANLNYYINYAEEIANVIAHFNKEPNDLAFFDFGMGWGKWSLMAKAFGCQSYGTELSETRIRYAMGNGIKVIKYDEIERMQFDFINCEQVFEHIPEPLETLRYLRSALRPGGIIKISVPNGWKVKMALSKMNWKAPKWTRDSLNVVAPLEHINCFQQVSLDSMAELASLKKIHVKFRLHFETSVNKSRDLKTAIKDRMRPYYHRYLQLTNQSTYLLYEKPKDE